MNQKFLCIQLKQIGDVLMTTPAVRALHTQFPNAEIHFLTQSPSHLIYESSPYVTKIIQAPDKIYFKEFCLLIKRLKQERYTCILDFFSHPKTALLSRLLNASKRIGFKFRGRSFLYTDSVSLPEESLYSAAHKLKLLEPLGIQTSSFEIDFFITDIERTTAQRIFSHLLIHSKQVLISVSPVSRRDYKVWPARNFAIICDRLIQHYNAQILFLWGPKEEHFIENVRKHMQEKDVGDYSMPTIKETVALLEKVDFHVGNDNGPMHFAIAAKIPTLAIFGRPKPVNWIPPNQSKHGFVEFDPGCKNGCYYPKCNLECIQEVPIEKVWNTLQDSIKKHLNG